MQLFTLQHNTMVKYIKQNHSDIKDDWNKMKIYYCIAKDP